MGSRVLRSRRLLLAAVAALALVTALPTWAPTSALARATFDVTGSVHSKSSDKETIILITDDLGKKNQPITIDMSDMSDNFVAIRVGQAVTLEVAARENDSYKAYSIIDQDSYVRRDNLGTQERYETLNSSIKAHVGNVPEDDESLNQQHRNNRLRRDDD